MTHQQDHVRHHCIILQGPAAAGSRQSTSPSPPPQVQLLSGEPAGLHVLNDARANALALTVMMSAFQAMHDAHAAAPAVNVALRGGIDDSKVADVP